MLFNSIEFIIFLPVVFILYWFVFKKKLGLQNLFIISASYIFYGWWDWKFLGLIVLSSFVDYFIGLHLHKSENLQKRKYLLLVSILVNLGVLGFFKYFNFFIDSFSYLLSSIGLQANINSLNIILPVGISFYTFQTLSYTIDIYRKKMEPTKNIIAFFAFVSFFPQLVAGPIERAANLLPQFYKKRNFNYKLTKEGLRQILWGLFKKIVVADTCAKCVDIIFNYESAMPGNVLIIGAIFFAFQIYGDFSGYSDIAIGTAKLFGFSLMTNFSTPYFSRDIGEFWKRWHISLSTWFRDYVYIPLGGNRCSKPKQIRNSIITFTVSGLWHGANWTFVFWGFLNGLYYIPSIVLRRPKKKGIVAENRFFPNFKEAIQIGITFFLTIIAWIFFRAVSIQQAFSIIKKIFSNSLFTNPLPVLQAMSSDNMVRNGTVMVLVLLLIDWLQRKKQYGLEISNLPVILRWCIYILLMTLVIIFFGASKQFIYFTF